MGRRFPEPLEHSREDSHGTQDSSLDRGGAHRSARHRHGVPLREGRRQPGRGEPGSRSRSSRPSYRSTRARRMAAAQAAGKIQVGTVPRAQVLAGAVNSASGLETKVALVDRSTPTSRSSPPSSATSGEQSALTIPDGEIAISVTLSDTGRVAGFVSPGATVAIFIASPTPRTTARPASCCPRSRSSRSARPPSSTPRRPTRPAPRPPRQLPKTLFTLAATQDDAERIMYASTHGRAHVRPGQRQGQAKAGPGVNTNEPLPVIWDAHRR